jgi:hypothetical protein
MMFEADIPIDTARRAHAGTSHVPEQRAEQERAGYASTLAADLAHLERLATTDEKRATLAAEFARYRAGYRRRYLAHLEARSRCMSAMITGPARFPTARNRKRNATADKRATELEDFRAVALKAIARALCPELAPIMAGDSDAITRLRAKLAGLEADREHEKRANAAIRRAVKALGRPATQTDHLAIVASLDVPEHIRKHLGAAARAFQWAPQFGPNTGAEIRRVEQRIAALTVAKATPDAATQGTSARVEESASDNRIRLYFPDKPPAVIRARLKAGGFRWADSIKAWQAYINHGSRTLAHEIAGVEIARASAPDAALPMCRDLGEPAPDCACHRGQHCDVSHDPAACDCGRCGP